jgi:hypothetical protein
MNAKEVMARVLLFGGLSLIGAGTLIVAPVAKADIDFECKPGCWGAAAASSSTGQEVMRLNYRTRQDSGRR